MGVGYRFPSGADGPFSLCWCFMPVSRSRPTGSSTSCGARVLRRRPERSFMVLSKLRRVLEPGRGKPRPGILIQTLGSSYRLAIEPDAVDAHRFKRLIDEARSAPAEVRAANFRRPCPFGGGRPWPTSPTSRSRSEPSPLWTSFGPGDRGSDRGGPRVGSMPRIWCPSWNSSSRPIRSASGCAAADACALPLRTSGGRPPGVPRHPLATGRGARPRTRPRPA